MIQEGSVGTWMMHKSTKVQPVKTQEVLQPTVNFLKLNQANYVLQSALLLQRGNARLASDLEWLYLKKEIH